MSDEANEVLTRQLDKFDYVARQTSGLKTIFYCVRDQEFIDWAEGDFFLNRNGDLKVFVGMLNGVVEDVRISVGFSIYIHRGRLFSIEYKSEPGLFKSAENFRVAGAKVLVEL
ncbi:hypothetical protein [Microbulbifer taiwanensis]|uniref:Uncharacterized protein n=1 Tax=Microbulbifer taiwanensis TaxID=986746 RepID=A0ABW1YQ93_9GAMM|nr:hypothetical protein [Microbulbifer taiwanensis]